MLENIIHIQYRQFNEQDLSNPYELNIIRNHFEEVKKYFFDYDFNAAYSLENLADYCLVLKISRWEFEANLNDDYKDEYNNVKNYFEDIVKKFKDKNLIEFIKGFDFSVPDNYGYDLCSVIYKLLPKFLKSLNEETFLRAVENEPYLVFDNFDVYKEVFKKFPSLYKKLFTDKYLEGFLENRFEDLITLGIKIIKNKEFPFEDVKNKIISIFDKLGEGILLNKDGSQGLHNQIRYKGILRFFNGISSERYNYFEEKQNVIDDLSNKWLDENGQKFSYEMPFNEIKKMFDNPSIPWYIKYVSLTHDKNKKRGCSEHFCVHAMRAGRDSIADLCSYNIDTNEHFGGMTQQVIGIYHNLYCNALYYNIHEQGKWNDFCINTENIIRYIFRSLNLDFKEVENQISVLKRTGTKYLFEKDISDNEKKLNAIDFSQASIKFTERLLRVIYTTLKKELKSFYASDKLTLGTLLSYQDQNNPLTSILTEELMQYVSYCLIKDKDSQCKEVGLNLRNLIMHDAIDYEKFNNANGVLCLLVLVSIINALFLHYNKVEVEKNKQEKSLKDNIQAAVKLQNKIIAELKERDDERDELLQQLKQATKKLFELGGIDDSQAPEILRGEIETAVKEKLVETQEYKEYLEILKKYDAKEVECNLGFINYYSYLNHMRENLMSQKYKEYIKKLAEYNLFFYMMSTPEIPENVLFNEQNIELVGQLFALRLHEVFSEILKIEGDYSRCIDEAIGLFEDNDYTKCSKTLFETLDCEINELEEKILFYKLNDGFKRFEYYEMVADKVLNFYNKIKEPLESWDASSLNYYDVQKEVPSYKTTDLDCIRLFLVCLTLLELKPLFDALNFVFENAELMKKVIERLNTKD